MNPDPNNCDEDQLDSIENENEKQSKGIVEKLDIVANLVLLRRKRLGGVHSPFFRC